MVAPPACFVCRAHCLRSSRLHSSLGPSQGPGLPSVFTALRPPCILCLGLLGPTCSFSACLQCMHQLAACPQHLFAGRWGLYQYFWRLERRFCTVSRSSSVHVRQVAVVCRTLTQSMRVLVCLSRSALLFSGFLLPLVMIVAAGRDL